MEIKNELQSAPLWGEVEVGSSGDIQLEKLADIFHRLAKEPTGRLRTSVSAWLEEKIDDRFALTDRLHNARILCVFAFNMPLDHSYSAYFSDVENLRMKRPDFLTDLNSGRTTDKIAIEVYFEEFDRLAREYGRRGELKKNQHPQ